jgi:hypothetical protein
MSMSLAWFIVTTSACKPSTTERACLLEPPWDCLTATVSPVLSYQLFAKAWLTSL